MDPNFKANTVHDDFGYAEDEDLTFLWQLNTEEKDSKEFLNLQILTDRSKMTLDERREHNLRAAVSRLYDDILTVIFCAAADPGDKGPQLWSQTALIISHVCYSWRIAALDIPQLWNFLEPSSTAPEWTDILIQRATNKNGLIDFRQGRDEDYLEPKYVPHLRSYEGGLFENTWNTLCMHPHVLNSQMEKLLLLNFQGSSELEFPKFNMTGYSPSLKSLMLFNLRTNLSSPIFSHLTTLTVSFGFSDQTYFPPVFTNTIPWIANFKNLPFLRFFSLTKCMSFTGHCHDATEFISFPRLEQFAISECDLCIETFLAHVTLPKLCTLHVFPICSRNEPPPALIGIVLGHKFIAEHAVDRVLEIRSDGRFTLDINTQFPGVHALQNLPAEIYVYVDFPDQSESQQPPDDLTQKSELLIDGRHFGVQWTTLFLSLAQTLAGVFENVRDLNLIIPSYPSELFPHLRRFLNVSTLVHSQEKDGSAEPILRLLQTNSLAREDEQNTFFPSLKQIVFQEIYEEKLFELAISMAQWRKDRGAALEVIMFGKESRLTTSRLKDHIDELESIGIRIHILLSRALKPSEPSDK